MHRWWEEIEARHWWDYIEALQNDPYSCLGGMENTIEDSAVIKHTAVIIPPVYIGENVIIDHFAVIKGPAQIGDGSIIGTYAQLRKGALIYPRVLIGSRVDVKTSIIKTDVNIGPGCVISDSLIERDAFMGGGCRVANTRLPSEKEVKSMCGDQIVNTGMKYLGCYIGRKASVGFCSGIYPGRIIPDGAQIEPYSIIK